MNDQQKVFPSEDKLRNLLRAGDDCVPLVQGMIDRDKLPYIILQSEELWCSSCNQRVVKVVVEEVVKGVVEEVVEDKCPVCGIASEICGRKKTVWTLRSTYTPGELWLNKFVTVDEKMLQMKQDAVKMSSTMHPVLVSGETGTGKELIAKSQIDNRPGEVKCVNCAGFPRELMEAELFGYTAGAFTGANKTTDGLIVSAKEGIMFFDEIGELPMDLQSKLLRVLQERTVRKVGGKVEEAISCKFVFATNQDLKEMTTNNRFRKDLYARISTLELFTSPLKERMDDVVPITESMQGGKEFLSKYKEMLLNGVLDLSLNVRSIEQYVIRYSVLGRVTSEL